MRKQKDTSTSLSASSSLCSEQVLQKLYTLEELLKKKDDKPFTFKEACAYLGYAPSYLYKLTYRNVIPHYKPTGKMIYFSKNEIDEWIYKSNVKLRIENAELKDENNIEKDPNSPRFAGEAGQIEMELKEDASTSSAQEIVIEFPLKSRRRK